PEMVGTLTESYRTIAIAGAHGKSTTTALAALTLIKGGLDPTVIIGTRLKEFKDNNFRAGHGSFLVLEADEYGRAFLNYRPLVAIIANIDAEHLDTYGTLANVKRAFLKFAGHIQTGGTLIANRDDKNTASIAPKLKIIAKKNNFRLTWYSQKDPATRRIRAALSIPGAHNVSNALAIWHLGRLFKIPERSILTALREYQGAWRRMEYRGRRGPMPVYDDYAHHPTEIKATLQAFREKFPRHRLLCVFEPHQAERLKRLFKDFGKSFDIADEVIIVPTYRVAGRDQDHPRWNAEALAKAVQKRRPDEPVLYLADRRDLSSAIDSLADAFPKKPRVIIMTGAGTIVDETPRILTETATPIPSQNRT
ncbi:MAG TPA: cyanophycin synthetase, partial [Candidatus Paceibacterota bacterium]|nr:cyanophycin synthetase [Candidatus Paceibacterota bacterium]